MGHRLEFATPTAPRFGMPRHTNPPLIKKGGGVARQKASLPHVATPHPHRCCKWIVIPASGKRDS